MKRLLTFLCLCIFGISSFISCKEDDETYVITYKLFTNEDEYVKLQGWQNQDYVTVKSGWEYTTTTTNQNYKAFLWATCENTNTLITIEIYINGKLAAQEQGNGWCKAGASVNKY